MKQGLLLSSNKLFSLFLSSYDVDDVEISLCKPLLMVHTNELVECRTNPVGQVLKERCDNDKIARVLLEQRHRTVDFRTRCRLCRPVKNIVATITGMRLEVMGRKGSVCVVEAGATDEQEELNLRPTTSC